MIEFDVDMGYLLEENELDCVVLNDENGEHEPIEFVSRLWRGECENVAPDYLDFLCSVCGFVHYHSDENDTGDGNDLAFCPRCGKAVKHG